MKVDAVRISGTAQRLTAALHLAESTPGEARFPWFPLGMPEMDEEDFRQFEITPENARKMVDKANADLLAGEEIWVNYGHNQSGPRAGDALRFEVGPDGSPCGVVKWNDSARLSIKQDPPEYKYFSPEFWAETVTDEQGNAKYVNGRLLLRPFEICGGALTNIPAMEKLAFAASTSTRNPSPSQASERKEQDMKLSAEIATLLKLDPEKASDQDVAQAIKALHEQAAKAKTCADCGHPVHAGASCDANCGCDKAKASVASADVKAQVREEMTAQREEIRKEVREELQKESAAKERKAKVERLVAQATAEGKVVADNRVILEAGANADPDAFEKALPTLPVIAPVTPHLATAAGPSGNAEGREAIDTKAKAYQAEHAKAGTPVDYMTAVRAVTGKAA